MVGQSTHAAGKTMMQERFSSLALKHIQNLVNVDEVVALFATKRPRRIWYSSKTQL